MKYRQHKGSLADSMATVVEFDGKRSSLVSLIEDELRPWLSQANFIVETVKKGLHVDPYGGADDRIGWKDVWIVTLDGYGVLGFTDGPPLDWD